jgi:hypothetical protein
MYAIRCTPNQSGFSPFELTFGRAGRTHLTFLKELWSGKDTEPEPKITYQYVLDLQNRIKETCEFAQREMSKIREKNQRFFNKNAKLRQFKVNDRVWVLNTKCEGKFDINWRGPATVIQRKGQVIYKIKFEDGTEREYHVNMIKPYVERMTNDQKPDNGDGISNDDEFENTETTENDCEMQVVDDIDQSIDNEGLCAAVMSGLIEVSDNEADDENNIIANDTPNHGIRLQNDMNELPLANTIQTETWKDVKTNPDLSQEEKKKLWHLVEEYGDIFSDVPTPNSLMKYSIKVSSDEIIRHKPYKVPIHLAEKVEQELDKLLKMGWIRHSNSYYASPLVVVKKKNSDELRICVSYKDLNRITLVDPMPQKDVEDIISKLGKSSYFSVCDASKGFYAIELEEDSRKYTGFVYQNLHMEFCVLPFGLLVSPAAYSRLMEKILYQAKNIDHFVDDLIAYNSSFDSHVRTLENLFQRLRNANVKIKPSKVRLGFKSIQYLGMVIGEGKLKPTNESIEKVLNAPRPVTKKGIRSFVGTINWLRRFVPHAAKYLKPFNELLSRNKSEIIQWGEEQKNAWEELKILLTSQPVLTLYEADRQHAIQCDASSECIAGSLMQLEDDGEYHPVMYASRKCLANERRYDIQNLEMLAIVWSCSRYYRFIYAKPFKIFTDSCALSILNSRLSNNARASRWQLYLQQFNFTVEVIQGKDNAIADFQTRMGT